MIFENNSLMAYEVVPVVQETITRWETLREESADELSQDSFLHMFKIKDDLINVIANYPKTGYEHYDKVNREYVEIVLDIMKYVNYSSIAVGISKRFQTAFVIMPFLQERCSPFYDNALNIGRKVQTIGKRKYYNW